MDSVLDATVKRINDYKSNKNQLGKDIEYVIHNVANPETKATLVDVGLIKTIFEINSDESYNDDIKTTSLRIVSELAKLSCARKAILSDEEAGIDQLASLLTSNQDCIREQTTSLLATVCFFQDSVQIVAKSKLAQIIFKLLFDKRQSIVRNILNILSNISNYVRSETPENVIEQVIKVLNMTDKKEISTCTDGLTCLWNICSVSQITEIAIKHQVINLAIVKFLDISYAKQEPNVVRHACGLLIPITISQSGKAAIIQSNPQTDIIKSLCLLISNSDIKSLIRQNVGFVLNNLSDDSTAILIIGKQLIYQPHVLINLLGNDKAAIIGHHFMQHDNSDIQQYSLHLIALICQTNDNQGVHSVWKCLNILRQLIDIFMTTDNQASVKLALDCIIMICQSISAAKFILVEEAKRSKPFAETALQIPQLQGYLQS